MPPCQKGQLSGAWFFVVPVLVESFVVHVVQLQRFLSKKLSKDEDFLKELLNNAEQKVMCAKSREVISCTNGIYDDEKSSKWRGKEHCCGIWFWIEQNRTRLSLKVMITPNHATTMYKSLYFELEQLLDKMQDFSLYLMGEKISWKNQYACKRQFSILSLYFKPIAAASWESVKCYFRFLQV